MQWQQQQQQQQQCCQCASNAWQLDLAADKSLLQPKADASSCSCADVYTS
jgi:hypothetical protein